MKLPTILMIIGLAFVAISAWGIYATSTWHIVNISVDQDSTWGKQFLETTGFPFLIVESSTGNRQRVEHVAFVGNDRSIGWFEQIGFSRLGESFGESKAKKMLTQAIPGANVLMHSEDGEATEAAYVFEHPMKDLTLFYYLPKTGMLTFDAQ